MPLRFHVDVVIFLPVLGYLACLAGSVITEYSKGNTNQVFRINKMTFRTCVLLIFQANRGTKLFHQRMICRITLFDLFTNENKLGCFILITRDLKI
jgi:hypothetical protein